MSSTPLVIQPLMGHGVYASKKAVVVKVDATTGEWKPVDHFEHDLNTEEMTHGYGLWTDKEVEKGSLFWKHKTRTADQTIQSDEVQSFASMATTNKWTWEDSVEPDTREHVAWLLSDVSVTGTERNQPTLNKTYKEVDRDWIHTGSGW